MGYAIKNGTEKVIINRTLKRQEPTKYYVWLFFTLFLISIIVVSSFGMYVKGASANKPEIEYLDYNVVIDNNYAITQIYAMFKNPYDSALDQTFTFQIPEKAYISNFSLTVDSIIYYAQVVPKSEARERYEESAMSGTDAGLVEAKGKNVFSYSVSLSPYQEIHLGLRYEQFIEKKLGGYEYRIPLSGNSMNHDVKEFSIDIMVRSELYLTEVDVENYQMERNNIDFMSKYAGRVRYRTDTKMGDDFVIYYKLDTPPVNGTMLNYHDGESEYFCHIFSPQKDALGGSAMAKDIIFVLDKSGSMKGQKIEQLKDAFNEIISQLPESDWFNIIMFDNNIKKYDSELLLADQTNKYDAADYIDSISAGGSTNINSAMVSALDMFEYSEVKVPIIVMLTDGLPTAGVTNPATIRSNIKNKNTAGVGIFSLGFGNDVDFDFISAMSLENYGLGIRIYEGEDASEQITNFYETISTPLLKNIKFTYSTACYDVYPKHVDQLFEGTEVVIVGKYAGENGTIKSSVEANGWDGSKNFKHTFELNQSSNHSFIPRLWAYQKIKYLMNELTIQGKNNSLEDNITDLALEYEFVTPFTSLLVEVTSSKETNAESDNDNAVSSQPDADADKNADPRTSNSAPSSPPYSDSNKPSEQNKKATDCDGSGTNLDWLSKDGDEECGEDCTMLISVVLCVPIAFVIIVILIGLTIAKRKKKKGEK